MANAPYKHEFKPAHLLGIKGLHRLDIEIILDLAETYATETQTDARPAQILNGKTVATLFNAPAPQAVLDIERAAKHLGANVTHLPVSEKRITFSDTATIINALSPDILVVRDSASGYANLLSNRVNCAVLNGGDGAHEHPLQALFDTLTIRRALGKIEGLKITICGDILQSPVARSTTLALHQMGAEITLCAPATSLPPNPEGWGAAAIETNFDKSLRGANVIIMLGQQNSDETFKQSAPDYELTPNRFDVANPGALVLMPGHQNEQPNVCVAINMAALHILTGAPQ